MSKSLLNIASQEIAHNSMEIRKRNEVIDRSLLQTVRFSSTVQTC